MGTERGREAARDMREEDQREKEGETYTCHICLLYVSMCIYVYVYVCMSRSVCSLLDKECVLSPGYVEDLYIQCN